jgi:hypothetical protein
MNESMPSKVHPPQAAKKARFWLEVSLDLGGAVATLALCIRKSSSISLRLN